MSSPPFTYFPIAVVGIGCRFPGDSDDAELYWRLLVNKLEGVVPIPADRWNSDSFFDSDVKKPGKHVTKKCGFTNNHDKFDAGFFGVSPREAKAMDPQQRKMLEVSWEAFEDAGIVPEKLSSENVGVFVGIGMPDWIAIQCSEPDLMNSYTNTGAAHSVAANRVSYFYGFRGPSVSTDTACASAVTACHMAANALWAHECESAVVGGVNSLLIPELTIGFSALGVLAPDGRCKSFDANANGYVRGEGFGAIIVKPLHKAIADGDKIYCLITGTAINDCGRSDSLTMPSGEAQLELAKFCFKRFGKDLAKVDIVEAHGTGTAVGDPIEATAIGRAYGLAPGREIPVRFGSVKSNIGHLECAAGIASLIKAALMLKKRKFVASLHFTAPNPQVDFNLLKLKVQTETEDFPNRHVVAAVNSFGFGGANALAIMEEYAGKEADDMGPKAGWMLSEKSTTEGNFVVLPLSAKSKAALTDMAKAWRKLDNSEDDIMALVRFKAQRRSHFNHRMTVIAKSHKELTTKLDAFINGENAPGLSSGAASEGLRIGFVFSGQGPQHYNMGRLLYKNNELFRETVNHCDEVFKKLSGKSLLAQGLFADDHKTDDTKVQEKLMDDPSVVQVALCYMQIALHKVLQHWGITPSVIVGHSLGEVAAAYASGGLSLENAIKVIHYRSFHQSSIPTGVGSMIAVGCTVKEAEALVKKFGADKLSIAAVNSPTAITIAGDVDAVKAVAAECKAKNIFNRILRTTHAFHSYQMAPLEAKLLKDMADMKAEPPVVPIFSTVTGAQMTGLHDAEYWWKNVRQPVLFQEAILGGMTAEHCDIVLEISPHPVLGSSVSQSLLVIGENKPILATAHRVDNEVFTFLSGVAQLYTQGVDINWERFTGGKATKWVQLPYYPWQYDVCWQEPEDRRLRRFGLEDRSLLAYKGKIPLGKFEFFKDHVVQGKMVFPGAGYVEIALETFFKDSELSVMDDVKFIRALFWPEKDPELDIKVTRKASTFEVKSSAGIHATGTVVESLSNVVRPPPFDIAAIKSRCQEVKTKKDCYDVFQDLGYQYGPFFQGIEHMTKCEDEVFATLRLPVDGSQKLPVTVLDACLQATLMMVGGNDCYLPIRFERLALFENVHAGRNKELYAYCVLLDHDPIFTRGDVYLLNEKGEVLMSGTNFTAQCITTNSQVDLEKCLYRPIYQPKTVPLPAPGKFDIPAIWSSSEYDKELEMIAMVDKHMHEIKTLVASYAHNATLTVDTQNVEVSPKNAQYLKRLREMAAELLGENREKTIIEGLEKKYNDLIAVMPFLTTELSIMKRIGDILVEILHNPGACLPILYAPDSLAIFFTDSVSTRYYYQAGSATIVNAVKSMTSLEKPRVVRVLEVGGRMGGFASFCLPGLEELGNQGLVEYYFTDLTASFFPYAQKNIGKYNFVKYHQLDIEKDPEEQGVLYGSCDIVVIMDTLHATGNMEKAIEGCHKLLAPGGWLVAYEPTNGQYLADLLFGCLDLWWSFSDDLRKNHCVLNRKTLTRVLEERGFDKGGVDCSSPAEYIHSVHFWQKTIGRTSSYAALDRKLSCTEWIVMEDSTKLGSKVIANLGLNDAPNVTTWELGGFNVKQRLMDILSTKKEQLVSKESRIGILFMWGLEQGREDWACGELLDIVHAAVETETHPFMSVWAPSQGGQMEGENPFGAFLVGFVRTAVNEIPELKTFTVDLEVGGAQDVKAKVLSEVIIGAYGSESELSVRGDAVYSTRILQRVVPDGKFDTPFLMPPVGHKPQMQSTEWKCEVPEKEVGKLDKFVFRLQNPNKELKPDEIRVKVEYSGYNFKGLMGALGLLEGLKSGPSNVDFGLEASGVVVAVITCCRAIQSGRCSHCHGPTRWCSWKPHDCQP